MVRGRDAAGATLPRNWAELLDQLGRAAQKLVCHGANLEEVALALHSTTDNCRLALAFISSGALLKFRSMVEDWSWEQIVEALGPLVPLLPGPKAPIRPL
jgi:hypothetical protein